MRLCLTKGCREGTCSHEEQCRMMMPGDSTWEGETIWYRCDCGRSEAIPFEGQPLKWQLPYNQEVGAK